MKIRLSRTVEKYSMGTYLIRRSPIKLSKYVVMGMRVRAKARLMILEKSVRSNSHE